MTERDESRDVFVVSKFGKPLRVYPGDTQVIDSPDGSEGCFRYVHLDQYTELETRLENARSSERQAMEGANKAIEERDRLRRELEKLRSEPSVNANKKGEYYIIDNRGTVGNCASFWAVAGNGYCCDIEEAGLFSRNYSDRETDVQIPREVVESCIVKHVRLDAIRSEMKKRGLEFKGGRLK